MYHLLSLPVFPQSLFNKPLTAQCHFTWFSCFSSIYKIKCCHHLYGNFLMWSFNFYQQFSAFHSFSSYSFHTLIFSCSVTISFLSLSWMHGILTTFVVSFLPCLAHSKDASQSGRFISFKLFSNFLDLVFLCCSCNSLVSPNIVLLTLALYTFAIS